MIHFRCPNCNDQMSVPESLAGQSQACPGCGNVTFVPTATFVPTIASAPAPPPASQAGRRKDVAKSVRKKLVVSPSMWRNRPLLFGVFLLGLLMGLMYHAVEQSTSDVNATDPQNIGKIVMAVFGGLLVLWWLRCKTTKLTITDDRVVLRHGLLAKHTNEVRAADVRNVQVSQGMLQRLFGVGTLAVSTAGTGGVEILVGGIPAPQRIKERIYEMTKS
jgi:membrane protein YdbS with pleckstrin-like domain